ncbi:hypothetical protein [Rhizocola hellebori]|nr:hypothetical protein [Rhizocola hellebori]
MLPARVANEALSPAGSMAIGLCFLVGAIVIGRYALRQRARDRVREGKEIGSVNDLFAGEYKGEPRYRWIDSWDHQFRPELWYWWMFAAIMLTAVGTTLTIRGLVETVT